MKRKIVYLNGVAVGAASTWHEVTALIASLLGRHVSLREIFKHGSEGPDGFFIRMQP